MSLIAELLAEIVVPSAVGLWGRQSTPFRRSVRDVGIATLLLSVIAGAMLFVSPSPVFAILCAVLLALSCVIGICCWHWNQEAPSSRADRPAV